MTERRDAKAFLSPEALDEDIETFQQLVRHYFNRGDDWTVEVLSRAIAVYKDLANAGGVLLSREVDI